MSQSTLVSWVNCQKNTSFIMSAVSSSLPPLRTSSPWLRPNSHSWNSLESMPAGQHKQKSLVGCTWTALHDRLVIVCQINTASPQQQHINICGMHHEQNTKRGEEFVLALDNRYFFSQYNLAAAPKAKQETTEPGYKVKQSSAYPAIYLLQDLHNPAERSWPCSLTLLYAVALPYPH